MQGFVGCESVPSRHVLGKCALESTGRHCLQHFGASQPCLIEMHPAPVPEYLIYPAINLQPPKAAGSHQVGSLTCSRALQPLQVPTEERGGRKQCSPHHVERSLCSWSMSGMSVHWRLPGMSAPWSRQTSVPPPGWGSFLAFCNIWFLRLRLQPLPDAASCRLVILSHYFKPPFLKKHVRDRKSVV